MPVDPSKLHAVITGDIINSSALSESGRRELYLAMKSGSRKLRETFGDLLPLEVDIFRGDSWQMLITSPELAFRIGLLYRLFIRTSLSESADTRLAIGIGTVSFLPGSRVGEGEGEAFRRSGRALEELPRFSSTALRSDDSGEKRRSLLDTTAVLIDAQASKWTDKQALAVYGALLGWRQRFIATLWDPPVSQQTVAEYLASARWQHLRHFLELFENRAPELLSLNTAT